MLHTMRPLGPACRLLMSLSLSVWANIVKRAGYALPPITMRPFAIFFVGCAQGHANPPHLSRSDCLEWKVTLNGAHGKFSSGDSPPKAQGGQRRRLTASKTSRIAKHTCTAHHKHAHNRLSGRDTQQSPDKLNPRQHTNCSNSPLTQVADMQHAINN